MYHVVLLSALKIDSHVLPRNIGFEVQISGEIVTEIAAGLRHEIIFRYAVGVLKVLYVFFAE